MADRPGGPVPPSASFADSSEGHASPIAAIILAAGKSTRMRSGLPKPLHPICGLAMTEHVMRACRAAGVERLVAVIGHEAELVRSGLGAHVEYAVQAHQRGTGDAVRAAQALLGDWQGVVLVLAGDIPLVRAESLRKLLEHHTHSGASATMLTAVLENATGYGRIVRDHRGRVARIVEERDATEAEKAIQEFNPSIYAFDSAVLWPRLAELTPENAQGEYYLTDVIGNLVARNRHVEAVCLADATEVSGVNTRVELAAVTRHMQRRILINLMLSGVTITDPDSTYVDADVAVGMDTVLEPSTFLLRDVYIGAQCRIGPLARIQDSRIGDRVTVLSSQIVGSVLEDEVSVGPFANIRAGSHLGRRAKVGDFVEIKNSSLGAGAQASHLAYLGDADVGDKTNIGAGVITCNYDGYRKHRTVIGKNVFVGSHSALVAPISVGDGAFIAAASAVTVDVPDDALLVARSFPTIKEGWAARYHEKMRNRQSEQTKG